MPAAIDDDEEDEVTPDDETEEEELPAPTDEELQALAEETGATQRVASPMGGGGFDPSKPFTVIKQGGGFDPSKPFTVIKPGGATKAAGGFDPSKPFTVIKSGATRSDSPSLQPSYGAPRLTNRMMMTEPERAQEMWDAESADRARIAKQQAESIPIGDRGPIEELNRPIVNIPSPSKEAYQSYLGEVFGMHGTVLSPEQAEVIAGVSQGGADALSGFGTPLGVATLGGGAIEGAVSRTTAREIAAIRAQGLADEVEAQGTSWAGRGDALRARGLSARMQAEALQKRAVAEAATSAERQRALSALFTGQMAADLPEQAGRLQKAVEEGDLEGGARGLTGLATTAYFTREAAKHALDIQPPSPAQQLAEALKKSVGDTDVNPRVYDLRAMQLNDLGAMRGLDPAGRYVQQLDPSQGIPPPKAPADVTPPNVGEEVEPVQAGATGSAIPEAQPAAAPAEAEAGQGEGVVSAAVSGMDALEAEKLAAFAVRNHGNDPADIRAKLKQYHGVDDTGGLSEAISADGQGVANQIGAHASEQTGEFQTQFHTARLERKLNKLTSERKTIPKRKQEVIRYEDGTLDTNYVDRSPEEIAAHEGRFDAEIAKVKEELAQIRGETAVEAEPEAKPAEVQTHESKLTDLGQFPIQPVPVSQIQLSKDVPNFKDDADPVTGEVRGQELQGKFEKLGTGPIVLWRRKNGDLEVISGRHRLALARRTGEETIRSQIVNEADGFTLPMAMRLDAELNIREGQGTTRDYVRYFNNSEIGKEEATGRGLLARDKGKNGWAIGKDASPDVLALYKTEKLSEAKAAAIAKAAPGNHQLQRVGLRAAKDGASAAEIKGRMEAAKAASERGGKKTTKAIQEDMWDDTALDDQWKEQGQYVAAARKRLQDIIATRKTILNKFEAATGTGSIGADVLKARAEHDAAVAELKRWENWAQDPELRAEVERGGKAEAAPAAEGPKLRKGEKQGDVFSNQTEDFKLAGEKAKGVEEERLRKEKEQKEKDKAEQEKKQGGLFTPDTEKETETKTEETKTAEPGKTETETKTTEPGREQAAPGEAPPVIEEPKPDEPLKNIEEATLPRKIEGDTPAPSLEPGQPVALSDIRKYLSKALDIPIRLGVNRLRALGLFYPGRETIRVKRRNAIPTIAHEVGHYLHFILFPDVGHGVAADAFGGRFDRELMALGARTSLPSYTPHQIRMEGVAEFVRKWLTDRPAAWVEAPSFMNYFETELQGKYPEVWKIMTKAQRDVARYTSQSPWDKILSKISFKDEQNKEPLSHQLRKMYTGLVDEIDPLHRHLDLLTDFGGSNASIRAARAAAVNYIGGVHAKVEAALFHRAIDFNGRDAGPSLHEILSKVDDTEQFSGYLVAARAVELSRRGIQTGIDATPSQIATELRLRAGYEPIRQELLKFQDTQLRLLLDSGIISSRQYAVMKEQNKDYVPYYRDYEGVAGNTKGKMGRGFVDTPQGVRRMKGDDGQIINPLESIVKNAFMFRDLAERNRIGTAFVDAVTSVRGGGRTGENVVNAVKPMKIGNAEVREYLKARGLDPDVVLADMNAATPGGVDDLGFTVWRAARNQRPKDGIFTVWRNGEQHSFQIDDPALFRALQMQDSTDALLMSKVGKILQAQAGVVRAGATLTLEFAGRNFFKDQITAGVFGKHGYVPFWDGFRGILSAMRKDSLYWDWVKSGGKYSELMAQNRTDLISTLKDVVHDPSELQQALAYANPVNVITNLRALSQLMEHGTRVAAFDRARKAGLNDMEAANEAKDITLNFARMGVNGKAANKIIAFFSAGVADIDKTMRAHKPLYEFLRPGEGKQPTSLRDAVRVPLKGFMLIGIPSLLTWYAGKDDKDIQELPPWRKAFFWNFKLGGKVWALPKPFLLGQIYGSSIERGLDYAYGRDPHAVRKFFAGLLGAAAVPMIPTGLVALVENATNFDFYRGGKIEPRYTEDLPVAERTTPRTSAWSREFAKGMDKLTLTNLNWDGVSPIKIDHQVRGMFGGMGQYGSEAIDWFLQKTRLLDIPPAPAKDYAEWPGIRGFAISPYSPGKSVESFYEGMQIVEQRIASGKTRKGVLTPENAKWQKDNEGANKWYSPTQMIALRDMRKDLGEISKAMRTVETTYALNPEAKRAKLIYLNNLRTERAAKAARCLYWQDQQRVY